MTSTSSNELSRAQLKNLGLLADYLEKLPADYSHFDMGLFIGEKDEYGNPKSDIDHLYAEYAKKNGGVDQHGCGTVACAIGHGPAAGILFKKEELGKDDLWDDNEDEWVEVTTPFWHSYSGRFANIHSPMWNWLFGSEWDRADNHHHGAAARIRYILAKKPLPENFQFGSVPELDHVALYAEFRKQEATTTHA